jgi:hypothetical protein
MKIFRIAADEADGVIDAVRSVGYVGKAFCGSAANDCRRYGSSCRGWF